MIVVQDVKKNFDVVLVAIAALEVRMLVCLSVLNEVHHFAMSVHKEIICPNRLMFVMFIFT